MKVYCYSKCTTCKRALKFLDENQISYELMEIKGNHPSYEEIKEFHLRSNLPLKKFFNTSGLLYKEYGLAKKLPLMSEEEMYKLLASDGMLVKRPLVVLEDSILLGFKEEEWQKKLIK
jgi:arsenate reductase